VLGTAEEVFIHHSQPCEKNLMLRFRIRPKEISLATASTFCPISNPVAAAFLPSFSDINQLSALQRGRDCLFASRWMNGRFPGIAVVTVLRR
jgi:hypothetical protein